MRKTTPLSVAYLTVCRIEEQAANEAGLITLLRHDTDGQWTGDKLRILEAALHEIVQAARTIKRGL